MQLFLTWDDFCLFMSRSSTPNFKHLTIVCFDGRDFKVSYFHKQSNINNYCQAENWAVFSVNTPDIFFSTDVRQEEGDGGKECAIVYQSFK